MKRIRRFLCFTGVLFFVLFALLTWLGGRLFSLELNEVISYHADDSSLYAAIAPDAIDSYLICRNDFRTGKKYSMRFPKTDGEGNRYELQNIEKEAEGNVAVLLDVYSGAVLLRSEIWVCCPSEGSSRRIYSCEYDEEEDAGIIMISDAYGILILKFIPISDEDGSELIHRTLYYAGQYDTPIRLDPLRIVQFTTSTFYAIAGQGIWYADRYGNVYHCLEDSTVVNIMKNDGSRVSVNNVGYSPTGSGFYFYNLDNQKDYWIGSDGVLTEFDNSVLDTFRTQGFQVWELGMDSKGVLYADLRRGDEPVRLAVMVQGEEPRIFSRIEIPAGFWLPYVLVWSVFLTIVLSAVVWTIRYIHRSVHIIPVSLRIFAAVTVVLLVGSAGIFSETCRLFSERRLKEEEEILCDAAWLEANRIDQTRLKQPDVNYFETRSYEKKMNRWTISEMQTGEISGYRREFEFGYFKTEGDTAYPILGTEYVSTPANYALTEGEFALLDKSMNEKRIVCGIYTENGFRYLAAYAPVLSGGRMLTGAVKCSLSLDYIARAAIEEAAALSGRILLGFVIIVLVVLLMIHGSLLPLNQLSVFIRNLEDEKNQQAMTVRGHNEISELIGIVNRMSENIKDYMQRVRGLQMRYGAFVPEDLVALFGTDDIRKLNPGDTAVCEDALLFLNMADFETLQAETKADAMFRLINDGLALMIPEVKAAGGHIVRFFQGGMLVLFTGGAGEAIACTAGMMAKLKEKCRVSYFAAMDYRLIHLEIIGSEKRMDFTIRPEDWSLSFRLQKLARLHELGIVLTEALVKAQMEMSGALAAERPLGVVLRKEEGTHQRIYELLEAQDAEQLLLKQETLSVFEKGLDLFSRKQLLESRECFAQILRKNSHDSAARRYFDLCDRLLSGSREKEQLYFDEI